jgi:hypothetical protein
MKKINLSINIIIACFCFCIFSKHNYRHISRSCQSNKSNLVGFKGFQTYAIDSVKANEKGEFKLAYSETDYGMGYLSAHDNKPFFIVLEVESDALSSPKGIKFKGESFVLAESVEIIEGKENQLFAQYATEHPRREQALSAWGYLEKIYAKDSLFAVQEIPKQAIANEKQRIKTEDSLFLAGLPKILM